MGCISGCVLLCIIILPVALQVNGIFRSEWIKDGSCQSINPKPSCCNMTDTIDGCGNSLDLQDLDVTAFMIENASSIILILPIVCFFLDIFFNKDGDTGCCGLIGGFAFLLYPIAGLLSFVGCMIIVAKYSGHTPGSSFYFCLASGLYVLVMTGISICRICYSRKHQQEQGDGSTGFIRSINIIHITIYNSE